MSLILKSIKVKRTVQTVRFYFLRLRIDETDAFMFVADKLPL